MRSAENVAGWPSFPVLRATIALPLKDTPSIGQKKAIRDHFMFQRFSIHLEPL